MSLEPELCVQKKHQKGYAIMTSCYIWFKHSKWMTSHVAETKHEEAVGTGRFPEFISHPKSSLMADGSSQDSTHIISEWVCDYSMLSPSRELCSMHTYLQEKTLKSPEYFNIVFILLSPNQAIFHEGVSWCSIFQCHNPGVNNAPQMLWCLNQI